MKEASVTNEGTRRSPLWQGTGREDLEEEYGHLFSRKFTRFPLIVSLFTTIKEATKGIFNGRKEREIRLDPSYVTEGARRGENQYVVHLTPRRDTLRSRTWEGGTGRVRHRDVTKCFVKQNKTIRKSFYVSVGYYSGKRDYN